MAKSPISILMNKDGYFSAVYDSDTITSESNALLAAGSDGTNAQFLLVDSLGRQIVIGPQTSGVSSSSGIIGIQGTTGGVPVPVTGTISSTISAVGLNDSSYPTSSILIGASDGTNLRELTSYNVNNVGSEHVLGVSLRKVWDGYSKEFGTEDYPFVVSPPSNSLSAFNVMRVAAPYTLTDLVNKYEIDLKKYEISTATGGTVTHIPNESAIRLSATGTNASSAKLRTNSFFRYQAGKGLRVLQTIYHNDLGQTNQVRRWGFFDDSDGLFWELNGASFRIIRRTSVTGSVVDNVISQSSFNHDTVDGAGVSEFNLDITKGNIYEISFQWLGVGTASFYINGHLVHRIINSNLIAGPYMKTAQLPLSWEIINSGSSTSSNFTAICSSVSIEGGDRAPHYGFTAFNSSAITVTTTERPILSIRLKSTYNSITNRMLVLPKKLSISTEGARIAYRIVMNASLTGASYTSVNSYSGVEYDISSTAFSGGDTIFQGFLANSNDTQTIDLYEYFSIEGRVLLQSAFATSVDTLTVLAVNEAAGSTSVKSSLSWEEFR
jgi:hypothetical protein